MTWMEILLALLFGAVIGAAIVTLIENKLDGMW